MVPSYNPRTQESEVEGSGVEGQPGLKEQKKINM